ncbi:class I SAM-dependent methyltransferase [Nocardioides sp. C4-1]|uniref:class I SAM-dependent methyltransferase n=1 Tax=Nocardioides sp. C4-1 TaxID=3151851 RepID=UPI0032675490
MTDQINRPLEPRADSFSAVFARALRGSPCDVVGLDDAPYRLPMTAWTREADDADRAVLALCDGPVLDVGCGPGRMAAALTRADVLALGIDVVPEAVVQAVGRGAPALRRSVFEKLPGEGRWKTCLLADGNVGIGGDPVGLLSRLREVLAPAGRVVVEVAPPGVPAKTVWATIADDESSSSPFRWSVVGLDDIAEVASAAGLGVREVECHHDRWVVVLEPAE